MDKRDDIRYTRPDDVPPELTPLERAVIAARQIRLWADWLLEIGPAPPKSDTLMQSTESKES